MTTLTTDKARKFGNEKPVALSVPETNLTSQQERWWEQTRAKLLSEAPGFTFILYQLMNPHRRDMKAVFTKTPEIPVAATDGLYLYLNVDKWFRYTLPERTFIVAHEVCHAILNHPVTLHVYRRLGKVKFKDGTEAAWDEGTAQSAADYIINDMLVQSKIGTLPKDGHHNPGLITHRDSFIDAYQKLLKHHGHGGAGNGFDIVLKPGTGEGKSPQQAIDERNGQEWKTAVAAAMASAKAQGKLPSSMQSMFEELLEPRVAWEEYIVGFFRRKLSAGSYDFRRPDRRLIARMPEPIYAPSRSGFGADTVVVAVDTSGSIGTKTLALFMGEMAGVLGDVRPKNLYVVWCDAAVKRVDQPEDVEDLRAMQRKGAPGRGGTDFCPVFEWVAEQGLKPDALLYLSDLAGTFPKAAPDYPILWGSIGADKAPFGEVVVIPNADKA